MKRKDHMSGDRRGDRVLSNSIRTSSERMEARFSVMRVRLEKEYAARGPDTGTWFNQPRFRALAAMAAAILILGFAGVQIFWKTDSHMPAPDALTLDGGTVDPVDMLILDDLLDNAVVLLDTEIVDAILLMPYENDD